MRLAKYFKPKNYLNTARHWFKIGHDYGVEAALAFRRSKPSGPTITRFSSHEEFLGFGSGSHALPVPAAPFSQQEPTVKTVGYCYVCQMWTCFRSSWQQASPLNGVPQINWREGLVCNRCQLNNRMRASIHLAAELGLSAVGKRVYATEQTTPLFAQLSRLYPGIVGSEYLGGSVPLGKTNAAGVTNQDLTRLTFSDDLFDLIVCFEVLEHIPNYQLAFNELARVLKPGCHLLFSVPFNAGATSNLIRARVLADNTVEHILPPEYHGDPLSNEGCLCFQHFGWEMFDQMRRAGFRTVHALLYSSREYGYLGDHQIQFVAEK